MRRPLIQKLSLHRTKCILIMLLQWDTNNKIIRGFIDVKKIIIKN